MPFRAQNNYRRILIIKPSSFGDVIHALPVLHGLRQRYPASRISWLVANSCAGLLQDHPELDEVILFDRQYYGRMGRHWGATIEFMKFVRGLQQRRFDLVVDLQGLFRSGFLALASGAGRRIGFGAARECAPLFYTRRIRTPDAEMHAVDRNYQFAEALGFGEVPVTFVLPTKAADRVAVDQMLEHAGIGQSDPYVLLGPGTRWETKLWPVEYFADIARRIREEFGLAIVLIGASDERERADAVQQCAGERVANLAGETTLSEVIALVERARLAVMHDSGPMHLATALHKPMVAIYGPTSPQKTGPYGRSDAVVRLDLPCSPCYIKRLENCPYGHRCMRDLRPDMIMSRIRGMLAEGTSGR